MDGHMHRDLEFMAAHLRLVELSVALEIPRVHTSYKGIEKVMMKNPNRSNYVSDCDLRLGPLTASF
jgi:hypothetical protein